jgi:hypothetical protein
VVGTNTIVAFVVTVTVGHIFELLALVNVPAADIVVNYFVPWSTPTLVRIKVEDAHLRASTIGAILTGIGMRSISDVGGISQRRPICQDSLFNIMDRWRRLKCIVLG